MEKNFLKFVLQELQHKIQNLSNSSNSAWLSTLQTYVNRKPRGEQWMVILALNFSLRIQSRDQMKVSKHSKYLLRLRAWMKQSSGTKLSVFYIISSLKLFILLPKTLDLYIIYISNNFPTKLELWKKSFDIITIGISKLFRKL